MICFLGTSHAPRTLAAAAVSNGLAVTDDVTEADLVFVSEDTPTNEWGERNLEPIRNLVMVALLKSKAPVILSSQVPPGFTRSFSTSRLYHMAETLRIKDAMERALRPEQFILGVRDRYAIPDAFLEYARRHGDARILVMDYEEAEFAKIAINMFLAAQVDTTNKLAKAAVNVGANWEFVAEALRLDRRIGPHAYLAPGRWQDSRHLLRDHVTLEEILAR